MKITKTNQIAESRLVYATVLMLLVGVTVGLGWPRMAADAMQGPRASLPVLVALSWGVAVGLGFVAMRWVNPPLMAATKERRIDLAPPLTRRLAVLAIGAAVLHFVIAMCVAFPIWLVI